MFGAGWSAVNPRHRRLLIPGLLIALIVVVVVASLFGRADAASGDPVVHLTDSRITESSGLAISDVDDALAYTINDSGSAAEVYAVDLATGAVVGVTTLTVELVDPEALALVDGRLWIADTGNNVGSRTDQALYSLDEPGRGDARVTPQRHAVEVPRTIDVEALLADPRSGDLYLVSKSIAGAQVFALTADGDDFVAREVASAAIPLVTDGAFSPDGSTVAVLTYTSVIRVDPQTWQPVARTGLPVLGQAETLDFDSGGTVLVGTEGTNSPLFRVTVPTAPTPGEQSSPGVVEVPTDDAVTATEVAYAIDPGSFWWAGLGGSAAVIAAVAAVVLWSRRQR